MRRISWREATQPPTLPQIFLRRGNADPDLNNGKVTHIPCTIRYYAMSYLVHLLIGVFQGHEHGRYALLSLHQEVLQVQQRRFVHHLLRVAENLSFRRKERKKTRRRREKTRGYVGCKMSGTERTKRSGVQQFWHSRNSSSASVSTENKLALYSLAGTFGRQGKLRLSKAAHGNKAGRGEKGDRPSPRKHHDPANRNGSMDERLGWCKSSKKKCANHDTKTADGVPASAAGNHQVIAPQKTTTTSTTTATTKEQANPNQNSAQISKT